MWNLCSTSFGITTIRTTTIPKLDENTQNNINSIGWIKRSFVILFDSHGLFVFFNHQPFFGTHQPIADGLRTWSQSNRLPQAWTVTDSAPPSWQLFTSKDSHGMMENRSFFKSHGSYPYLFHPVSKRWIIVDWRMMIPVHQLCIHFKQNPVKSVNLHQGPFKNCSRGGVVFAFVIMKANSSGACNALCPNNDLQ